jgi:protein-S-isoprenylcysteine O-methyltransferase Ste14
MKPSSFRATAFEFRFRFLIHAFIFLLGFTSFYWGAALGLTKETTWLELSALLARANILSFLASTNAVHALALLFLALGAWFRTWGTAYVSQGVVQSPSMHGTTMLTDGPYRRTRNPLYLGTLLHTLGLVSLMPPSGAIVTVTLLWIFQIRLALAEEPFLVEKFGQPYLDYAARVPRFLPSFTPRVPATGAQPHWLQAFFGELYFSAAIVVFAIFGWDFNAAPLHQGILIALGLWLVARAFFMKPATTEKPA